MLAHLHTALKLVCPRADAAVERVGARHPSHRLRRVLTHWSALAVLLPLLLFLCLRLAVHAYIAGDPVVDDFPSACPPDKLDGCDRVSMLAPHSNACVSPPVTPASCRLAVGAPSSST